MLLQALTLRHPRQTAVAVVLPRAAVMLCIALWLCVGLFGHEPYKPDEAYTVGLVKSVVDGGDWVVPHLAGEPFVEKPPLFFDAAALLAKTLPALPLHEAARLAVVLFAGLGLLALAAGARAIHGAGTGRLAAMLALSNLGVLSHMHQLITDVALFSGVSVGLLGLALARDRPRLGGVSLGAGVALSFLSKGLLGPGLLVCTALALVACKAWRGPFVATMFAWAAFVALPLVACWLVPLALGSPDQFHVWLFDNNLGRFFDLNELGPKKDLLFYVRTLAWFALPCWPLAAFGLLRTWRDERPLEAKFREAPPLLFLAIGIAVLTLSSDGRELYALVLVPALSVAATSGLLAMPLRLERRVATSIAALMLLLAVALLGGWVLAMLRPEITARLPAAVAQPTMLAPSWAAMAVYGLVAFMLLALLARLRVPFRGALPFACATGIALVWASLMLPWGAYLDSLKGYRAVAQALGEQLPQDVRCIASQGLGESERALLDYFIGLRTRRVESDPTASQCDALLVQSLADSAGTTPLPWRLRWQGGRGGFDSSILQLYQK